MLSGAATVDMQQCYVEVRACWTQVADGSAFQVYHVLPSTLVETPACATWIVRSLGPCSWSRFLPCNLCLQGGLNSAAVEATKGGHLTCKDSLLVGWGGGTNNTNDSCPVAESHDDGTQLNLDR
jgi:hypothetical protein